MNISTQQIVSILRQIDIEGYIQLGAPTDEYDSEAHACAMALNALDKEEITQQSVSLILNEIWRTSFNLSGSDMSARQAYIEQAAKALMKDLNR